MKWSDLTLKERKQIYDAVRAENPNASYFDIKSQFDSIPEYEDGIMLTNTDKGYVDWKSKLASNLKNETYGYDLYEAYKSGAQQQLEDDGYYHLPTRDPKTNKILKYPSHNTFWLGITEDIKQGYYPQVKDGRTYTVPVYEDGGIHIKKKNKGKFNALKKRTGKSTEELTHSKNPLTRKRAIFAQNAAKWNKGKKKK